MGVQHIVKLSKEQTKHLYYLIDTFDKLNAEKYRDGAAEHEGNLWDLDLLTLLKCAREEAVDLFNYLQTAIDKVEEMYESINK